jgi:hypothetical protein
MTMNGCVYHATDDPTMFALERTSDADTTGAQPSNANRADNANVRGAVGTSGTTTMTPGGAAGPGATTSASGRWYRLSKTDSNELASFAGKSVRVTGRMVPGNGDPSPSAAPQPTDREPSQNAQNAMTAMALRLAPQFVVEDITPVEGQCRTSPAAPASPSATPATPAQPTAPNSNR